MTERIASKSGFRIPDGYFEHLPAYILDHITTGGRQRIHAIRVPFPVIRMEITAALCAGIILASLAIFLVITRDSGIFYGSDKGILLSADLPEYLNLEEATLIECLASEIPGPLLSFNGDEKITVELDGEQYTKDEIIDYLIERDLPVPVTNELTISAIINSNN
jgi:hypothetical protein